VKFFVAGIKLDKELASLQAVEIAEKLTMLFPFILTEAAKKLGDDVVTIIVLHEYALTKKKITHADKKKCLAVLQEAVKKYPRLILIPGSFASTQILNKPAHIEKMQKNYQLLNAHEVFKFSTNFVEEYSNFMEKNIRKKLCGAWCVENAAYLFFGNAKYKHHKYLPYFERVGHGVTNEEYANSVFYIGNGMHRKSILIDQTQLDVVLSICRDHHDETFSLPDLQANRPFMQVIVSDSINIKSQNLCGALNIQMDGELNLHVSYDSLHTQYALISHLAAKFYVATKELKEMKEYNVKITDLMQPEPIVMPYVSSLG
jgi:hypothetical protein